MRLKNFLWGLCWFIVYFVVTEGFGVRMDSWGGLGSSSVGWFGALQILAAVLLALAVVPAFRVMLSWRNSSLGLAVLLMGALPAYLLFVSMVLAIGDAGFSSAEALKNLLQMKFFLMVYLFVILVRRENGLHRSLELMGRYAVITAVCFIGVVLSGVETAVFSVTTSSDATRFFRVIFPGAVLVGVGWIYYLTRYLTAGDRSSLLASLVCAAATVAQLHRGTLAAVLFVVLAVTYWSRERRAVSGTRHKLVLILFFVAVSASFFAFSSALLEYLSASREEVFGFSSNFAHRFLIAAKSWDYMLSETAGFGVGLRWERVDDLSMYLFNSFVAGPTLDSSYANIIIVMGLPGVLLYAFVVWKCFQFAAELRASEKMLERQFGLFLGACSVFLLAAGVTSDVVLLSSAAAISSFILVCAARIQHSRRQRYA